MPDPKPDDVDFHEETDSPSYADDRNFYKVEKWTRDGTKVDSLLYAGNSLGRARAVFESAIKHRPRIRLTLWRCACLSFMSNWSDEETDDPTHADRRNFYKVGEVEQRWHARCRIAVRRHESRQGAGASSSGPPSTGHAFG